MTPQPKAPPFNPRTGFEWPADQPKAPVADAVRDRIYSEVSLYSKNAADDITDAVMKVLAALSPAPGADSGLRAAMHELLASAGDAWQDIETAPKDETLVLGWDGTHQFVMYWRGKDHLPHQDKPGWFEQIYRRTPTHWKHLGAPPSALLSRQSVQGEEEK